MWFLYLDKIKKKLVVEDFIISDVTERKEISQECIDVKYFFRKINIVTTVEFLN